MSSGNHNGFGGFPQQPQAPSGWGFPQQQQFPPQMGGGYRTPAGPTATHADETWFEVEVPFAGATVPNRCACCCGPHEVRRAATTTVTVGRTHYTRRMEVPYCRACDATVRAGGRRGLWLGLMALAAAVAFPFALAFAWEYAPAPVTFVATPLVALGALFLLGTLWKETPIARERGATSGPRDAVWMLPFNIGANPTRLAGTNETWMRQLAELHHVTVAARGKRRATAARYVAVPILATLAAIPAWYSLHGRVYFDNPTLSPLTFDIDHGLASITVPAGGHDDLYLPYGRTVIDVMFDGRAADRIAGEVEHFGKHVATPFGQGCYATMATAYGTATVSGPREQMAAPGLRWHTLDGVQNVLEPFPRSVSVGRGQSGATRRRFTRVHCSTGAPLL